MTFVTGVCPLMPSKTSNFVFGSRRRRPRQLVACRAPTRAYVIHEQSYTLGENPKHEKVASSEQNIVDVPVLWNNVEA